MARHQYDYWENFTPKKLDNVVAYSHSRIAEVFGTSKTTIDMIMSMDQSKNKASKTLTEKVHAFAESVGYKRNNPIREHRDALQAHRYSSIIDRENHFLQLRRKGLTNAQIAKIVGYSSSTVRKVIGPQPAEYTQMSALRRGAEYHRRCEDRNVLAKINLEREKRTEKANAQVKAYNAAVEELARLNEEAKLAKTKYDQQKSVVDQMHDALSSYAEYATMQIISIPAA